MTNKESSKKGWLLLALLWGGLLLLALLTSCKSVEYVKVPEYHTEYKTRIDTFIQKDSCVIKDSVYIHAKGDTIWYEKWHTQYVDRWKEKIKVDTLMRTDSISIPYPVEKKLSRFQQFCLDYGKIMLGATLLLFVALTILIIRWIKNKNK